jgi:riboflavin biosynthesis pyrimidine reductase
VEVPIGKVIISTHITLDGVIGPSPEGWAILEGEGERYKVDQLLTADAFLLGRRKVYEGLASVHVEPKGAPEVVDVVLEALRPSG